MITNKKILTGENAPDSFFESIENMTPMQKEKVDSNIAILAVFDIVGNDDRMQWEFTPRVDGYTSYTVSYSECQTKADACIAVWRSLSRQPEGGCFSIPIGPFNQHTQTRGQGDKLNK